MLADTVEEFLAGRWAEVSRKFVYATGASANTTALSNEIERLTARLAKHSIEFEVWDQEDLSKKLKGHPEIVDDFFGRPWVKAFCGVAKAKALSSRLDSSQVSELRGQLARIYEASFGVADSGLIALQSRNSPAIRLLDRFVTPYLVSTTPQTAPSPEPVVRSDRFASREHDPQAVLAEAAAWRPFAREEGSWLDRPLLQNRRPLENPHAVEQRLADEWIGTETRQVIVGDPGAGKSTLLRFLVLDLLSPKPAWRSVAEKWGQCLPVWLPFHFFTQRVVDQTGASASVGQALKAWLNQHDASAVWPLVEAALRDGRLLLVVDGLDEWVNEEAGRYAIAALETFAQARSTPIIVSARPYALTRLKLGHGWTFRRIAPLTSQQQGDLAFHYFRAVVDNDDQRSSMDVIRRSVDLFLAEVVDSADLRAISGNPLFLVLLVGLHLSNVNKLPSGRFDVYHQAVKLLLSVHPSSRRAAAAVTAQRHKWSDRRLRTVLGKVAFQSMVRGDISNLDEPALREYFLQALRDPNQLALGTADAEDAADQLMDIAEGELGILVRKGPRELGFLHGMLQEQLAAEYVTEQLSSVELKELLAERLGDFRWREVILATIWMLRRPPELRDALDVIKGRINETPVGLHAREILAEVTFGPYDIPAPEIQKNAPDIIEAIETHPFETHRARLLDILLMGLEGASTSNAVRQCLDRWTLCVEDPSSNLVRQIAKVSPSEDVSQTICKLLIGAIHHSYTWVAFEAVVAIAFRFSTNGLGTPEEREILRSELLQTINAPPSGLAQAASLAALALGWREDPLVGEILNRARGHTDSNVRLVALCDVLDVLRTVLCETSSGCPRKIRQLTDHERDWLLGRLKADGLGEPLPELLVAAVTESSGGQQEFRNDLVESLASAHGKYSRSDLIWPIALTALPDNDQVADIVCNQLRSEKYPDLVQRMMTLDGELLLALAYGPESLHGGRVSAAIEDRLRRFGTEICDRELFGLAAVDRGPLMKEALLQDLAVSSWPHWAAQALLRYFGQDASVHTTIRSVLLGDPVSASKIAFIASATLSTEEVIPCLLAIMRGLSKDNYPQTSRYDFLVSALVQACEEQGISGGLQSEEIAAEALELMPRRLDPLYGDFRHYLAAAFYPSRASKVALKELEEVEGLPIAPYLRAFRDDPGRVRPFMRDALKTLRTLPAYLRARLCRNLADRGISTNVVMSLTRRWADEVSGPNKSIASLAYHRALLRARQDGHVDDEGWNEALFHLGEQASCGGPDMYARRRGAWVGMSVLGNWSALKTREKEMGLSVPTGILLTDPLDGPDLTLLQLIASQWKELRSEFGDTLMTRLSGAGERQPSREVWDALALVAAKDDGLQRELETAVSEDPKLLGLNGVLVWFATQSHATTEAIADALASHFQEVSFRRENVVSVLVADAKRIGLQREELRRRLEKDLRGPYDFGNPALEALAVLVPEHPAVQGAWQKISTNASGIHSGTDVHVHPRTYFAVACAAVDSSEILQLMERSLGWLDEMGWYYYENVLARHMSYRIRRDADAARSFQEAVMSRSTPDPRAAQFASLLVDSVGLDEELLYEVERRISAQNDLILAPVVRDLATSATLSVWTIFTRAADAARDIRLA